MLRQPGRSGKNVFRQLFAIAFQNLQLFALRQSDRFHARIGKITVQTFVLLVKKLVICPIEIKCQPDGFSDTPVAELGQPGIKAEKQ